MRNRGQCGMRNFGMRNERANANTRIHRLLGLSSFRIPHSALALSLLAVRRRFRTVSPPCPALSSGEATMAGFKTHIATSTTLGIGYGAMAHFNYGLPVD